MNRGQLTWRGVTYGIGFAAELVSVDGLDTLPDADTTSTLNARTDGAEPGEILAQGRTIDVEFEIVAGDTAAARRAMRRNMTYTRGGVTEPLVFRIDDVDQLVNAQLLRRSISLDSNYTFVNQPKVQWFCPDPRIYGAMLSGSAKLPTPGVGLEYPFTYPAPYVTVAGEPGSFTAENAGSESTPPLVTIIGPVDRPNYSFTRPDGSTISQTLDLVMTSGETFVIDVAAGTALLDGADRSGLLLGTVLKEMMLPPGNTLVAFTAFSGTSESELTLQWAPAEM